MLEIIWWHQLKRRNCKFKRKGCGQGENNQEPYKILDRGIWYWDCLPIVTLLKGVLRSQVGTYIQRIH